MKNLVVILLGPPGAGKGTQGILLSDRLGLFYLETSKIIENKITKSKEGDFVEVEGRQYLLSEEKRRWEEGELVSTEVVTVWMQEKIKELAEKGEGILFSGSPRTVYEAERISPILKELYGKENIKVVLIGLSVKESIFRNSYRRICELMRHPILYTKETKNLKICPLDGSKLITRALDTPEVIEKRYQVYQERTLPLIEVLEKEGLEVKNINGEQSVTDVFKDILQAVE